MIAGLAGGVVIVVVALKFADMVVLAVIVSVHVFVDTLEHNPPQEAKLYPVLGLAVKVTDVAAFSAENFAHEPPLQEIVPPVPGLNVTRIGAGIKLKKIVCAEVKPEMV